MGMFDSFYDSKGGEWQTKALACLLDRYEVGYRIDGPPIDYQMEVIGGRGADSIWTFATIRDGRLAEVPCERDHALPLRCYTDGWVGAWECNRCLHYEGSNHEAQYGHEFAALPIHSDRSFSAPISSAPVIIPDPHTRIADNETGIR